MKPSADVTAAFDYLQEEWKGRYPPSFELFWEAVQRSRKSGASDTARQVAIGLIDGRWPE